MNTYKIYQFTDKVEDSLRIALLTSGTDDVVLFSKEYRRNEELHTNLFHPSLWELGVKLMLDRITRVLQICDAEPIYKAFVSTFNEGYNLHDLPELESFEANFYMNYALHKRDKNAQN